MKPEHIRGYSPEETEIVRQLCLYIATLLGDLLDRVRVVGGLVPNLIVPADQAVPTSPGHIGTQDLDLGLELSVLDNAEYREISSRLRNVGFEHDVNSEGRATRQRWIHPKARYTVDFLIPPSRSDARGGTLLDLEHDFAAIVTPGLEFAFQDFEQVRLNGTTILGEIADRQIWVCGPAAFVLMKALALRKRGENKDAYDLHYVLKYWSHGYEDIVTRLQGLHPTKTVVEALEYLEADFLSIDSIGPARLDQFMGGQDSNDEELRADATALVREFTRAARDG